MTKLLALTALGLVFAFSVVFHLSYVSLLALTVVSLAGVFFLWLAYWASRSTRKDASFFLWLGVASLCALIDMMWSVR